MRTNVLIIGSEPPDIIEFIETKQIFGGKPLMQGGIENTNKLIHLVYSLLMSPHTHIRKEVAPTMDANKNLNLKEAMLCIK